MEREKQTELLRDLLFRAKKDVERIEDALAQELGPLCKSCILKHTGCWANGFSHLSWLAGSCQNRTTHKRVRVKKCKQCGKLQTDESVHIKYGADLNNPRKHEFEEDKKAIPKGKAATSRLPYLWSNDHN